LWRRISSCTTGPQESNFGVHPDMEGLAENGAEWGGFHLVSLEALSGVLVVVNDIVYDILFTCP